MRYKLLHAVIVGLAVVAVAAAQKPYERPDDAWITLNGMVVSTNADSFELDYGPRKITVTTDSRLDWYGKDITILEGHNVTVSGRIDDDWFADKQIAAETIYVNDFNTFFNMRDLPSSGTTLVLTDDRDIAYVTGTVASIKGREFTIKSGSAKLTVDTEAMKYNPMDATGYQQIQVGDRVQVSGEFDRNFLENDTLSADRIVTLFDNRKDQSSSTSRDQG